MHRTSSNEEPRSQIQVPPPPTFQKHIDQIASREMQNLHMIWTLQANKREIITNQETQLLQAIPNDNKYPFYVVTLFNCLYECLVTEELEQAKLKWMRDGAKLLNELHEMLLRRNIIKDLK
jgi:hypothetical protein